MIALKEAANGQRGARRMLRDQADGDLGCLRGDAVPAWLAQLTQRYASQAADQADDEVRDSLIRARRRRERISHALQG